MVRWHLATHRVHAYTPNIRTTENSRKKLTPDHRASGYIKCINSQETPKFCDGSPVTTVDHACCLEVSQRYAPLRLALELVNAVIHADTELDSNGTMSDRTCKLEKQDVR